MLEILFWLHLAASAAAYSPTAVASPAVAPVEDLSCAGHPVTGQPNCAADKPPRKLPVELEDRPRAVASRFPWRRP